LGEVGDGVEGEGHRLFLMRLQNAKY
jgi:hypothetical protein